MASAIGQCQANPRPIRGVAWVDVRDFGATPGFNGGYAIDNTPAFQRAHDHAVYLIYTLGYNGATIYVPGNVGSYTLYDPVFLTCTNLELRGDGFTTRINDSGHRGFPMFCMGMDSRGVGTGTGPGLAYRPDLFNPGGSPKLDGTVVTAANQRWGVRTNGDRFLGTQSSHISHGDGDYWVSTPRLTIDVALEGFLGGSLAAGGGTLPPSECYCNGTAWSIANPYGNAYWLTLQTTAGRFAPVATNTYAMASPHGATGVQRVAFQVDLTNPTSPVTGFLNGTQVAITNVVGGTAPALPAGSIFSETGPAACRIGDANFANAGIDFACYGFCLSLGLRYANRGAGLAQVQNPQFTPGGPNVYLSFPGAPTGGHFTITYGGNTTGPIAYPATAAAIQSALQGLASIGTSNIFVSQVAANYFVMTGAAGVVNADGNNFTADGSGLTGGTPTDRFRYFPYRTLSAGTPPSPNGDCRALCFYTFTEMPLATGTTAVLKAPYSGGPNGGTFTLSYGGQTTVPISAAVNPATIQSALASLSTIGAGNVTVVGSAAPGVDNSGPQVAITLAGSLAGAPIAGLTVNSSLVQGAGLSLRTTDSCVLTIEGGINFGQTDQSVGMLFSKDGPFNGNASNQAIRDVQVSTSAYGSGVYLGQLADPIVRDCGIYAGLFAIASLDRQIDYIAIVQDSVLSGSDAAVMFTTGAIWLRNIQVGNAGRNSVYLSGADADIRDLYISAASPQVCTAVRSALGPDYGGTIQIDNLSIDFEGQSFAYAALAFDLQSASPYGTVKMDNLNLGSIGAVPIIRLNSTSTAGLNQSKFICENLASYSSGSCIVQVDGPGWVGEVRYPACGGDQPQHVISSGTYGPPGIVVRDTGRTPQRLYGSWTAGTSIFQVPAPLDGQPDDWRCARSGINGSPTPPAWAARNPSQADATASLAGYSLDHSYMSVTFDGQASVSGGLTRGWGVISACDGLFGNGYMPGFTAQFNGTGQAVVALTGAAGGTFTIAYQGQTTAPIAYNATAAAVQAALQALPAIGAGNILVSGPAGGPYALQFAGLMAFGQYINANSGNYVNTGGDPHAFTAGGAGLAAGTVAVSVTPGESGGYYTLSYGGYTSGQLTIAGDTTAQVQAALQALPSVGSGNITFDGSTFTAAGAFAGKAGILAGLTIDSTHITGGAVYLTYHLPPTWWFGLSSATNPSHESNSYEPPMSTGYAPQGLANNLTNFPAASGGLKSNAVAITFPAMSQPFTVNSIVIKDSPVGGHVWATIQLAQPVTIAAGATASIPIGGLTIGHAPYAGTALGMATDYAWGKLRDLYFGAAPVAYPTAWNVALSTAPVGRSGTVAEPTGGGYARVGVAADSSHWTHGWAAGTTFNAAGYQPGELWNTGAVAFPAPTGTWGTIAGAALLDAGGNAWFSIGLPAPVSPVAGGAAPTFAAGALYMAPAC